MVGFLFIFPSASAYSKKDLLLNLWAYISRSSKIGLIEGYSICSKICSKNVLFFLFLDKPWAYRYFLIFLTNLGSIQGHRPRASSYHYSLVTPYFLNIFYAIFDGSWCLNNNQLFCKIIYFHNIFQLMEKSSSGE